MAAAIGAAAAIEGAGLEGQVGEAGEAGEAGIAEAEALLAAGRLEEARARALSALPELTEAGVLVRAGALLMRLGLLGPAAGVLGRAVGAASGRQRGRALWLRAMALGRLRSVEADAAWAAALAAIPAAEARALRVDHARWLLNEGRLAEAEAAYRGLMGEAEVEASAGLAAILHRLDRAGEGIALLGPVVARPGSVERDPNVAFTWARLCQAARRSPGAASGLDPLAAIPVVDRALAAFPSPDVQAPLRMARGRALDAAGAPGAFVEWSQAHRLEGLRFDPAAHRERIRAICAAFPAPPVALPHAPVGAGEPTPVFIVGMPRSGTSLTEQILACHPEVCPMGEREEIRRGVEALRQERPDPAGIDPARLLALRRAWQAAAPAESLGARAQTDKMPGNLLYLGWIAQAFPDARIVWCRRDPMDVALSCYQTELAPTYAWSRRLEWIASYELCNRLIAAHWKRALPIPIHTLDYERLVRDPEPEIRRLLAFCGLPWDPACLSPHLNRRYVATASFDQVRQPIGPASVGRWRRYAAELEPLRQIYARAGVIS